MNYVVIIPARYKSSRLPGKPLIKLLGVPMIIRTYQQVAKCVDPSLIFVATDNDEIEKVCRGLGIQVLMTSKNCLTGTDRVAECVAKFPEIEVFINIQGDEPLFNPEDIETLISAATLFPQDVINGYCEIRNEHDFFSGNTPKVVMRQDGRLLYMSRAGVPTTKCKSFEGGYRQVCCYAFPRKALLDFHKIENKTPLEEIEDIEILRFLEMGYEVRMVRLSSLSIPVDTFDDIALVEQALKNN